MIGWPVEHSRSPAIHNAAFEHLGLDLVYAAFGVRPGDSDVAVAAVRALGLCGLSVTMPHKSAVIASLDQLTANAERLGAVNCIVNRSGTLIGDNTDGAGFVRGFEHDSGRSIDGMRVVVCGAGGAARAIIAACADADALEIAVHTRNDERALEAASLAPGTARVARPGDLEVADLVVNATPVGMRGSESMESVPFDPALLRPGSIVVDIVYDPIETVLLREARRRGLAAFGGLSMLAGQAALQFSAWTGVDAPFEVMLAAARV